MLSFVRKLLVKSHRAKRFHALSAIAPLLVAAALAGCGEAEQPEVLREPDLPATPPSEEAKIAFFLDLLSSGDRDELVWAMGQLAEVGEPAAVPLAEYLERRGPRNSLLVENLLTALARSVPGGDVLPVIVEAAESGSGRVRVLAASALGNTGRQEAVAPLLDLACDPSAPVARSAAGALATMDGEEPARGLLGRFSEGLLRDVKPMAVEIIGRGLPAEAGTAFLLELLEGDDDVLAVASAGVLEERGDARGRDAMASRLPRLDGPLRWAALDLLARGADERALPSLLEAAGSESPQMQVAAASLLGPFEAPAARAALLSLSKSTSANVRREAYGAMHRSGVPEAIREVSKLLRSSSSDDRLLAAQLLGQFQDPATSPDIVAAMDVEEQTQVRLLLGRALAKIGRPEDSPAVMRILLTEGDDGAAHAFLAYHAASILSAFRELPEPVLDQLALAAAEGGGALRNNATKVLVSVERGSRALAAVRGLLADPDPDARRLAAQLWLALPGAPLEPLVEAFRREPLGDVAALLESVLLRKIHAWVN